MFCRQCEQTVADKGCVVKGVCGKDAETAALQDLLIHSIKAIGVYAKMARELGVKDQGADRFVIKSLFTTVTNVNFDPQRLKEMIDKSYKIKEKIKGLFLKAYKNKHGQDFNGKLPAVVDWTPADTLKGLIEQGSKVGIASDQTSNEDIKSLRELLLHGLKGMAAFANHAFIIGKHNEEVNAFFHKGLAALSNDNLTGDDLTALVLELGQVNLKCMEMLDQVHTERFGHPEPTKVHLGVKSGPAILISGHDLFDLDDLLKQTQGKGINIYTHGEMLPTHAYPGFKKYPQLVGHYGTAWQNQQKEFDQVPGAVLMTTNCIQKPKGTYQDRIFTTGLVTWPNVTHISSDNNQKDFSKVIEKALALGGFKEDRKDKEITIGFAHKTVLGVADKVIGAVKSGAIKHFFLIGGCDGAKPGRNYYTEFAQKVPQDCVILTLACGKFRFNKLDFGEIGGIPRLLDCGQCNDAYSAIKIASALAKAFKCSVNELPLSFIISWYEQKAVCILLTLLSLGIKNIRLGPSLPAFISPNVLKVLVKNFSIRPISTVDEDLREILG